MGAPISIPNLIMAQAAQSGVPPSIALAVAQKESSVSQWNSNGSLVTGTSGEVGVFQLMPGTAAQLGVNPSDVSQNIQGGITLLAQLFQKYGNWNSALSAYNSGTATGSPSYATSVLSIAASLGLAPGTAAPTIDDSSDDADSTLSTPLLIGLALGGVAIAWWLLD